MKAPIYKGFLMSIKMKNSVRIDHILSVCLRITFVIIFLGVSQAKAQGDEQHPILVISSYNPDTRNTTANITEFVEEYKVLEGNSPIIIENMNCKSLPEAPEWKGRMKGILDKYSYPRQPEVILLLGQEAWSSYISQDSLPFERVPVLIGMASQNAIYLPDSTDNITDWEPRYIDLQAYKDEGYIVSGFANNYDVLKNVDLIRSFYPNTKNIALLTDNTYGGVALQTYVKKEMQKIPGLNFIPLDGRKSDIYSIIEQIKALPSETAILIGTWRVDMNDGYQVGNATYTMMIANPSIPAFSITSTGIGHWAIGGYVPMYRSIGKDLAKQVIDIINKKVDVSNIFAETIPNVYTFDVTKIKELGIQKSTLPKHSTFVNDDESFLDKYKYEILLLIITILTAFLVMVFIFFLRTKRFKDKLMDLQEDNTLIMNNMHSSIKYIKPDFTVKWQNNIDYPCTPQYGPHNCFLSKTPVQPYCDKCSVIHAMDTKKEVDLIKDCDVWGRYIHVVVTPVLDDKDNLLGVVIKKDDVSKQKKTENELRIAKEKAEESDKLKSSFLANMSHEIRTPLNAIVGFSSLLAVTEDLTEKMDYMNIINNNNDLLLQLINDILDISKIKAGTLDFVDSDVDVNSLFHELEQSMRLKIKQPNVILTFEDKLPSLILQTDKNRLAQVMTNFLNNAIKFTEEGTIKFGYRLIEEEEVIYFYVADTGCGMPEEGVKEVFQRFVKLNSFIQGTGLGLSICETIVRKMNGEIGADSVLGEGSTFWFKVPESMIISSLKNEESMAEQLSQANEQLAGNETISSESIELKQFNALIADENIHDYLLLQSMMKEANCMHAVDGEEAFAMYSAYQPDILFISSTLLENDEFNTVEEIRNIAPNYPIIIMNTSSSIEDEAKTKEYGGTDFIIKPIQSNQLYQVLIKYLQS